MPSQTPPRRMKSLARTEALFRQAKKLALINPINGDGLPTFAMVHNAISDAENDAENDAAQESLELAMFVRRLAHIVRKSDEANPVAAKAVEFLKCTGHAKPISR